jgi:D-glycero-D-manno-heptose 1,7-bisphosphate phosphatase
MSNVKAVFLDRDGVLNSYLPQRYVESPDQLVIVPGAASAIRRFNDSGVLAIVISNQQGVGRNIMSQAALDLVTSAMKDRLAAEAGARLDAIYYCPHSRCEDCRCRKPKPGMILDALERFGLDPRDTLFVGDSETDMKAARAASVGIKGLVLTGAIRAYDRTMFDEQPDCVFCDLGSVADWVLEERD